LDIVVPLLPPSHVKTECEIIKVTRQFAHPQQPIIHHSDFPSSSSPPTQPDSNIADPSIEQRTMDPASSGDDSSSQSGSDAEIERRIEAYGRDSNSGSSEDEDEEHEAAPISNFDDLPTDDSEEESDDESGSDYNQKMNSQHSDTESSDDDDVPDEDVPLSERVASRAQMGRRYFAADRDAEDDSGKRQKAQNKRRAIELASERLKQVRKGKHGNQEKEKAKKSSDADAISSDESSIEQETKSKRKKSKHAPTEMSSKRRDFFSRGKPDLNSSGIGVSIGANKYKPRDPRMVSLSGHLDTDLFEKRYSFLHEVSELFCNLPAAVDSLFILNLHPMFWYADARQRN
jgi:hypothetical protein